jgi:hypothetical protein
VVDPRATTSQARGRGLARGACLGLGLGSGLVLFGLGLGSGVLLGFGPGCVFRVRGRVRVRVGVWVRACERAALGHGLGEAAAAPQPPLVRYLRRGAEELVPVSGLGRRSSALGGPLEG